MSLGERIEERLKALGLSQAELARRADVPQTTMNSLIRGNARTTPHLIRIARELQTTPAFLMGETDDPRAEFPAPVFTAEELEWIYLLRRMKPMDRRTAIEVARWRIIPNDIDRLINEDYWDEQADEIDAKVEAKRKRVATLQDEAEQAINAMPPESQKAVRERLAQAASGAGSKPRRKSNG
jgi:transcriptional regulator with XRE-family HTH domain